MARAFSGGDRTSSSPSLPTPESARGAPVWPARSSGRPGAPSQGQGFAAHPVAVALHGHGMEAGPHFQVRPGAASAPPAEPAFGAGAVQPAPGADGTTVRASQPLNLARREQGTGGRRGTTTRSRWRAPRPPSTRVALQRHGGRRSAVVAWLVPDTHAPAAPAGWRPEPAGARNRFARDPPGPAFLAHGPRGVARGRLLRGMEPFGPPGGRRHPPDE